MTNISNQTPAAKSPSAFWKAVRANMKSQHQAPAIIPVLRDGNIPLSFGQERLWFVEQLRPGNPVHNLFAVFRLKGSLNVEALEQSLREIIRRHEILRTTFHEVNGQPVQVISHDTGFTLPVIDSGELPAQQQAAEVQRLSAEEARQPFDLTCGPLLRLKLLRVAAEEYVLLRTMHHIISDRWSHSVFMRELGILYTAFSSGQPSPLPELPIQYADFAQFQRQRLQGDLLKARLDYWKQQLSGKLPVLQLPVDKSPSTVPTSQGRSQFLVLPGNLTVSLKTLSHREGVSLFVMLLAAFNALLYQYSGQEDIIVCSPVAGRNRVDTKKLIGYFNNLVLIRTSLRQNPNFCELAGRVSQITLDAYEHQDLPFQQLADSLNIPDPNLSRVMFTLQNVPSQPLEIGGVRVIPVNIEEGIANFDLSLSMKEQGEKLIGILRYKTDMFQESTMAGMLENFRILLEDFAANPNRCLADLPRFTTPSLAAPAEMAYTAPENEIEHTIATVWQDVLHQEKIGIHANFFELGGRSLAMLQVCNKLQAILGREVPLTDLLTCPTISEMARYLSQEQHEKPGVPRPIQTNTARQKEAIMRQKQFMKKRKRKP